MALEKKEITVTGFKDKEGVRDHVYIFEKFPATKGLDIQLKLMSVRTDEEGNVKNPLDATFIKDVICSCVYLGSNKFNSPKFDEHFSGRYAHLMEVYSTALMYNFDENFTESGTEE